MIKPPCVNCLVLPMCRSYVYRNPDKQDTPNMIVRWAIRNCDIARDYIYIIPQEIETLDGRVIIMNHCDEYRLALLYDYFICNNEATFERA